MDSIVFVSAQPDQTYFHWQVELYLYQFAKHGIADRCYAIFGYRDKPSEYAVEMSKRFKHIVLYKDDRDLSVPHYYIPSIRPHLLKQFFANYPELGKTVFYHDSDIFLVRMPRFELMTDSICYVSDTISYIGSAYIQECQGRYKAKYPDLVDDDLLQRMCDCVGLSMDLVKANNANSGGAQYLLKDIDAIFWQEVEQVCQSLYTCMREYDKQYPIAHSIQSWTSDMWTVLWLLWKRGSQTRIHQELDFSWAVWSAKDYYSKPIFHLAGVTTDPSCKGMFYKGAYTNKNIFTEYRRNKALFDNIDPNNATYEYVSVIKEYVDASTQVDRFVLDSPDAWSALYRKSDTLVLGMPLWRSDNGHYIIFNNGTSWILTASQYEKELNVSSGGFASSSGYEPYYNEWNPPCSIRY
jgi:hypothetical protein